MLWPATTLFPLHRDHVSGSTNQEAPFPVGRCLRASTPRPRRIKSTRRPVELLNEELRPEGLGNALTRF